MANIKEEKLRKLKKSFTGGAIVALLLLGTVIFAAFAATLVVFCMYMIDSKVRAEYDTSSKIAEVYGRSGESEAEDLMSIMYIGDRDYIITDAKGYFCMGQ